MRTILKTFQSWHRRVATIVSRSLEVNSFDESPRAANLGGGGVATLKETFAAPMLQLVSPDVEVKKDIEEILNELVDHDLEFFLSSYLPGTQFLELVTGRPRKLISPHFVKIDMM